MAMSNAMLVAAGAVVAVALYLYRINTLLRSVPKEAQDLSPRRWTQQEILETYDRIVKNPIDFKKHLPPRLDRRYIIVGGSGLVGGDIALQLLQRGQSPASIRIVDFRAPSRPDMLRDAAGVDFAQADITAPATVEAAFARPWPAAVAKHPLTVFHTAAAIRPGERLPVFYPRVERVNVGGTAHVIAAARRAGADVLVATSSGSVAVVPARFWVWPWRAHPTGYVQLLDESDFDRPLRPRDRFFANYAASKAEAERLVCAANGPDFRTGTIRPCNGVYGMTGDQVITPTLLMGNFVSFTPHVIQNCVAGRNVALAHLQFEAALLSPPPPPSRDGAQLPGCAGRPFNVTDPNPSASYRDWYAAVIATSERPIAGSFPPPVLLFLLAYVVEAWCAALATVPALTRLGLAEPGSPVSLLQPAVFTVSAHMIFSDAAARRSVRDGGIGYTGGCTTLEGVCEQLRDWNRENREEDAKKGKAGRRKLEVEGKLTQAVVDAGLAPEPVVA